VNGQPAQPWRSAASPRKAIILLAHGSRDPLWHQPLETVAARMRVRQPELPVCCAYLELEQPDLGAAAAQVLQPGIDQLTIVPMFLGTGKHAREDLPGRVDALRRQYPAVSIALRPPVGEDARIVELLSTIALE
jgi:sirohydrochlorin cobaltochelatase